MLWFKHKNSKNTPLRPYTEARYGFARRSFLYTLLVLICVILLPIALVQSAPVLFTQTDWSGVVDPNTPVAQGSFSGWTGYGSKDTGVVVGTDVQLVPVNYTLTQTSADGTDDTCAALGCLTGGGFEAGTFTNTAVSGKGAFARVHLDGSPWFTDWSTRYKGVFNTTGNAKNVAINGNYAFVADEIEGLRVIDISDPLNPTLEGTYNDTGSGNANGVAVSADGNTAYVAYGATGLEVVDVTTKNSPTRLGGYDTSGDARDVVIRQGFAFVADGAPGLVVLDISNRLVDPTLITAYPMALGTAFDIELSGNGLIAYVANGDDGLKKISIASPGAPQPLGAYDTSGIAYGVAVENNFAYVADNNFGLQVFDIGGSGNPSLEGSFNTAGLAYGIAVHQEIVYLADSNDGLQIFDVNDPTAPVRIGTYDTAGIAYGAGYAGNYVYLADGAEGLLIFDATQPIRGLEFEGEYDTTGTANGVDMKWNHAVVIDTANHIHLFDVRTPTAPALLGTYSSLTAPWDIVVKGDFAYVADGNDGLKIVEVRTPAVPTTPSLKGSYDTSGLAKGVAVDGIYAYVADDTDGLVIFNVNDPASPTHEATFSTPGTARDLVVANGKAYVADGASGLQIIDVSTPDTPTLAGGYSTTLAYDVALKGNHAYIADSNTGLEIVDVTDPGATFFVGTYDTGGTLRRVKVRGDYAYLTDDSAVIHVLNISTPATPRLATIFDSTGNIKDIVIHGNYAYVADETQGLRIIKISTFQSSGTYESPVLDLGGAQDFIDLSWNPSALLAGMGLTMEVRAGNVASVDGSWTAWTAVTNAADSGTVFDGNRYTQYKADLSTTNPLITPRLDDVSLDFSNFPVGAGLVSSIFDTGNDNGFITDVNWTSTESGASEIRVQIATSGNGVSWNYCGNNACSTSGWLTDWNDANNYYTSVIGGAHAESRDAVNDRYFRYHVWMVTDGTGTPILDNIDINFDTANLNVYAPDGLSSNYAVIAGTPFNVVLKINDSSGSALIARDDPATVKLITSAAQPDKGTCTSSFSASASDTEYTVGITYSSGQATIPVTLCNATLTGFTISAEETVGGALTSASNLTITSVALASPLELGFGTQPPPTPSASLDFNPPPVVHIQDTYGNIDTTSSTSVTLSAFRGSNCTTPVTGTFTSTPGGTTSGVATFSNVTYDTEETIYIKAEGGGMSACSTAVTVVGTGFVVQVEPSYDSVDDAIDVAASLLRNGSLVTPTGSDTISLSDLKVLDNSGTDLSGDLSGASTTANSVFYGTWDPVAGVDTNRTYQVTAEITYNGTAYSGSKIFNAGQVGAIADTLDDIKTKANTLENTTDSIQTKAGTVSVNVLAVDTKLTAHKASQAAYRAQTVTKLDTLKTNIGSILTDTSTTVPDLLKKTIADELAKGSQTEIVTTQTAITTGSTLPFRFRTATGLSPTVTVLDSKQGIRINAAKLKEIGGTGIYQIKITFAESWGVGNFMIRVDETTKQSVDNIVLNVIKKDASADAKKKASKAASAISLDTLYSRMNSLDTNMDVLTSGIDTVKGNTNNVSTDINDLLDKLKGTTSSTAEGSEASNQAAQKLGSYISSVSSIIGTSGSTSDYRTILGKLNGIEDTLTQMDSDTLAAQDFNENARGKAEKIRKFVTLIMTEYEKQGTIKDPEEKAGVLEDYLTELKQTVTEIPASLTTEAITSSVEYTLNELDAITVQNESLQELVPMAKQELKITETKSVEDLTSKDMLDMRNDVSGLKSLMIEIRGLLDTNVNKPVVHGWLEGN